MLELSNELYLLLGNVNLQSTLALRTLRYLRTLAITDKIQIPDGSYRGLTENDSRYYGITDTFCGTKITFLFWGLSEMRTQ